MKENNLISELLNAIPEALASPFNKWHEDTLNAKLKSEQMRYEHEEQQQAMKYQHEERMELARLQLARMETIQVAIEKGLIHPRLGQELQKQFLLEGKSAYNPNNTKR